MFCADVIQQSGLSSPAFEVVCRKHHFLWIPPATLDSGMQSLRVIMNYRCVATSVTGFVQQIACCYLRHGFWWYVTGIIPDYKDAESVDRKLIARYNIDCSEWRRTRNKQLGQANLHYLRHDHFFVLLASKGNHAFYSEEAGQIRDLRRVPLRYKGYSISYRPGGRTRKGEKDPRWHAHVQIDQKKYQELKSWFESIATRRNEQFLTEALSNIPWEPYAPVRRQKLNIVRAVNKQRKPSGRSEVSTDMIRLKRRIVKPFETAKILFQSN